MQVSRVGEKLYFLKVHSKICILDNMQVYKRCIIPLNNTEENLTNVKSARVNVEFKCITQTCNVA